jgi:CheY-like chemotaxis protein
MRKITSRFPDLRVLLVEDYFINQEVTKDLLELMHCTVDVAEDGNQAIELASQNDYDLIVMDLQIPGIDGYEVTRRLRQNPNPSIKQSKIIALTASALDGDRERCLEAGMDDYISKPMEADVLEDILRKHFSTRMKIS